MGIRLEHVPRSRGIETNLEVSVEKGEILGHSLAQITPGFEQPQREVLGGTDALRERVAEQAAVGHELAEQMGDLQEEVATICNTVRCTRLGSCARQLRPSQVYSAQYFLWCSQTPFYHRRTVLLFKCGYAGRIPEIRIRRLSKCYYDRNSILS